MTIIRINAVPLKLDEVVKNQVLSSVINLVIGFVRPVAKLARRLKTCNDWLVPSNADDLFLPCMPVPAFGNQFLHLWKNTTSDTYALFATGKDYVFSNCMSQYAIVYPKLFLFGSDPGQSRRQSDCNQSIAKIEMEECK